MIAHQSPCLRLHPCFRHPAEACSLQWVCADICQLFFWYSTSVEQLAKPHRRFRCAQPCTAPSSSQDRAWEEGKSRPTTKPFRSSQAEILFAPFSARHSYWWCNNWKDSPGSPRKVGCFVHSHATLHVLIVNLRLFFNALRITKPQPAIHTQQAVASEQPVLVGGLTHYQVF